jgi:hypothetical protein
VVTKEEQALQAMQIADLARFHPLAPAAIQRSADHHYTFDGKTYPGVTGILKVLDKSGPLMAWAARQTAEAAINLYPQFQPIMNTTGPEGLIKMLTSRSSWKRDEAANLGTEVHALADMVVNAQPTPPMPEPVRLRVLKYADWWKASGWTLRISEAMVVHPDWEYGGTFDLLARDRDGKTVLADIKTGKGVYREAVLQLTAYGLAKFVAPVGSPLAYPMPPIDRYVVLHVTLEGVTEIEINVGDLERLAWLGCLDLARWSESMKGKRL